MPSSLAAQEARFAAGEEGDNSDTVGVIGDLVLHAPADGAVGIEEGVAHLEFVFPVAVHVVSVGVVARVALGLPLQFQLVVEDPALV